MMKEKKRVQGLCGPKAFKSWGTWLPILVEEEIERLKTRRCNLLTPTTKQSRKEKGGRYVPAIV